jgi:hypothetical protein
MRNPTKLTRLDEPADLARRDSAPACRELAITVDRRGRLPDPLGTANRLCRVKICRSPRGSRPDAPSTPVEPAGRRDGEETSEVRPIAGFAACDGAVVLSAQGTDRSGGAARTEQGLWPARRRRRGRRSRPRSAAQRSAVGRQRVHRNLGVHLVRSTRWRLLGAVGAPQLNDEADEVDGTDSHRAATRLDDTGVTCCVRRYLCRSGDRSPGESPRNRS